MWRISELQSVFMGLTPAPQEVGLPVAGSCLTKAVASLVHGVSDVWKGHFRVVRQYGEPRENRLLTPGPRGLSMPPTFPEI